MKKFVFLVLVLSLTLGFSNQSWATLLGSYVVDTGPNSGPITDGNWTTLEIAPIYYDDDLSTPVSFSSPFTPFGFIDFSTAAVGDTFISNSSSSDFAEVANLLTNGLDDKIGTWEKFGINLWLSSKNGVIESAELGNTWITNSLGYTIDYMELTVLSKSFNYDSIIDKTRASYAYRVDIYSGTPTSVPDASIILLLGSSLIGLAAFRRKPKRTG